MAHLHIVCEYQYPAYKLAERRHGFTETISNSNHLSLNLKINDCLGELRFKMGLFLTCHCVAFKSTINIAL